MNIFASMVATLSPKPSTAKPAEPHKNAPKRFLGHGDDKDRVIKAIRELSETTIAMVAEECKLSRFYATEAVNALYADGKLEHWQKKSGGPYWYRLAREGA